MSQSKAVAEAKRLQAIVQRHGVKCTIELMAGRPWTGSAWYSEKEVLMNHHTAGPSSGLTPSYALCRKGRSDVPGPLCNGYGGRDHVFRIVTMGLANHPGAGGPLTVAGVTMPKDSARIASFGIEWEHNGTSAWPAGMQEFMGRVGAAVLEWMGRPLAASIEHKTWAPSRKIDRNNFTASTGQALIKKYQGVTEDDFMAFINNQAEFEVAMTRWAKSDVGKQQLANACAFAWRGPTIKDAFKDMFEERVNAKRGIYGFGSDGAVTISNIGAHKYAWASYLEGVKANTALAALTKLVAEGSDISEETIKNAIDEAFDARIAETDIDFVVAPGDEEETGS